MLGNLKNLFEFGEMGVPATDASLQTTEGGGSTTGGYPISAADNELINLEAQLAAHDAAYAAQYGPMPAQDAAGPAGVAGPTGVPYHDTAAGPAGVAGPTGVPYQAAPSTGGESIGSIISSIFGTGAQVYTTVAGKKVAVKPVVKPASTSSMGPILAVAGVAVVGILVLKGFGGKGKGGNGRKTSKRKR